jgi:hypothetical protein
MFSRLLIGAIVALLCATSRAQSLPDGVELGMSVAQLQQAVGTLKSVPHPARMAGGLVGSWTSRAVAIAGVELAPTYFFATGQLRRIEYLASSPVDEVSYDAVLAWARKQWGAELSSQSPEGAYANWAQGEVDVYLQRVGGTQSSQIRLVVKRRVLKNASEL